MNTIARVLDRLIRGYHTAVKAGGVECRIVVPGLTPSIAEALHSALCAAGLPSFLVVPTSMEPSRGSRKLRPEGLTSLRHGDMIIIAWPGEISRIQDSIIGAGGTVRTFTFSDEWPWIDDGNEYFLFDGPFIEALLDEWQLGQDDRHWFKKVIEKLLAASRTSVGRGAVVLDQILGTFNPVAYADVGTVRGKFMFHCGLPMPEDFSEDVEDLMERCESLGNAIGEARLEVDTRTDVLDRIREIEPNEPARALLQAHVEALLDGLASASANRYSGILTLRGCWGANADRWHALPVTMLRRLFDPSSLAPKVILKVRLTVHGGLVSPELDHGILFEGGTADVEVTYDGLPREKAAQSQVVLLQGHRTLRTSNCAADLERDVVPFNGISYEEIFGNGSKKKTIRVQLRQPDVDATEDKVSITPCGTNSPLLVVLDPGFEIYSASADVAEDEDAESVEISEPIFVTTLRHDSTTEASLDVDNEGAPLVADEADRRICRCRTAIDPSSVPAGRRRVVAAAGPVSITLDLEAKDFERGEFTLERELVVQLTRGNSARVSQLSKVFAGTAQQPYAGLGGINDQTRRRSAFARVFEDKGGGGLPIVADMSALTGEVQMARAGWVYADPVVQATRLRSLTPSQAGQDLLKEYAAARAAVIDAVTEGDPPPQDKWPNYCWYPVFVEKRRTKIDSTLSKYIEAYTKIAIFLKKPPSRLSWEEVFVLTSLDSVVHLGGGDLHAKLSLLGPWHPLVIAKRFMVQAALLGSARKNGDRRVTTGFHRLAVLLDQVSSFRWVSMLSPDATTFVPAYVSPTSDPGWLLAINTDAVNSQLTVQLLTDLRRTLGLETALVPFAREQMAADYLKGFHRAYPTRRAIALSASNIYSSERIVQSAESILYSGDGVSQLGNQLPGGLHLFVPNVDDIERRTWRVPPVCVYDKKSAESWSAGHKDILLLPPGKPRVAQVAGKEQPLARGTNDLAAFCAPVRRISFGAGGVPSSYAFERDMAERAGSGVGPAFTRALHHDSELFGNPVYSGWVVEDLPEKLEYLWNIVPGSQVDPAVLVQYVRSGFEADQARVLWDYNMSLTGPTNSYFVLSQVPQSIAVALNGSPPVKSQGDSAKDIIRELAEIGLAAGSESLRSGSKALGVVGLVAAIRLFISTHGHKSPLDNSGRNRGFLLPVDSFKQILGDGLDTTDYQDSRRADLVACQLCLDPTGRLKIYFAAVECKYSSGRLGDENASAALEQAGRTYDRLTALAEAAKHPSGIPERLVLLSLLSFGLRLRAPSDDDGLLLEHKMFQRILDGQFDIGAPVATRIAVITECGGQSASFVRKSGIVIYLSPGHWPGRNESSAVGVVRDNLASLFLNVVPAQPAPPSQPSPPPATTPPSADDAQPKGDEPKVPKPEDVQQPAVVEVPQARLSPILLGCTSDRRPVTYDPQAEMRPLDNYNVMITGSSGKGKTQLIKAMVAELRHQGRNVLLLDFKNDFASDAVFLETSRLSCYYVTFDGLPYNPLIPMPVRHPQSGREYLQISQHITGITAVLSKTFGLGAQQEAALKDVIRDCYRDRGIDTTGSVQFNADVEFPDFNDVGERLRASNATAYNRMDPLFDLGVFSAACRRLDFEAVLRSPSVIDLSQIQSDSIKNAIAKIIVLSAHAFYNARPHSSQLRQFFVFDEAHRILDTEFLVRFVRECRAYGVGVLLSSQNPSDFAPEVSASLNSKIIHGNGAEKEQVKAILRILGLEDSESAAVAALGLFEALISNPQNDAVRARTFAYPHYLVLSEIRRQGKVRRSDLAVNGVDFQKLSPSLLVGALLEMGLVEEVDGVLAPL